MDVVTADRSLHGEATPESSWRAWLGAQEVPAHAAEKLVPPAARLVVVAPHPDDEVLACGGLLAMHVARGGRVAIVAVTDGEASHAGSSACSEQCLAAARRTESVRGLACLGVQAVDIVRLGIADGRVNEHRAALAEKLAAFLDPADVVVATFRLDGHPDHEMVGQAAARACTLRRCRLLEAPVWLWHWAEPAERGVPWPSLLRVPLSEQARACKRAALAEHQSQLRPRDNGAGAVLDAGILERSQRDHEFFFTRV